MNEQLFEKIDEFIQLYTEKLLDFNTAFDFFDKRFEQVRKLIWLKQVLLRLYRDPVDEPDEKEDYADQLKESEVMKELKRLWDEREKKNPTFPGIPPYPYPRPYPYTPREPFSPWDPNFPKIWC